jgi:hypothetical protein
MGSLGSETVNRIGAPRSKGEKGVAYLQCGSTVSSVLNPSPHEGHSLMGAKSEQDRDDRPVREARAINA